MNKRYLSQAWLFVLCFFFSMQRSSPADGLKTPAEETRYTQYSQNEEIARFLSALDFLSPEVTVQVIGKTKDLRDFHSQDLFLVIVNEEGAGSPEDLNRQKPTLLLTAAQHGNEQSAKEAVLGLARDLAVGVLKPLLKKANFLLVPQANPFGNWFDQRQNEQDLDLNRDHVKLESPEVRAVHRVFREWMPEVTMDVHEKGDDYYRVSIGCVSNANIHPLLQEFSRKTILAEVEKNLEKNRVTFHEYLVTEEMGVDTSAGVSYRADELAGREEMKRYSTTDLNDGRNSLGIYETLSFIQEGASRHDLKTLEQRTGWQYLGLRFFIESVAAHGEEIVAMVKDLRARLLEESRVYSEDDLVHLRMQYVRDKNDPSLMIKVFDRADVPVLGILKVDKKAGEPVAESELESYPYPAKYKVLTKTIKNWFPDVAATLSISRPLGYVIPAGHQDVIAVLLAHGLRVDIFKADKTLDLEAYMARQVVPSKYDYLPPDKLEVEKRSLGLVAKKGDYYVSCSQAGSNLIACLLEPQSQYGLIRYWTFKLVPEEGDLYAFYRLTTSAELPLIPCRGWTT
jgi:hypothetical protein